MVKEKELIEYDSKLDLEGYNNILKDIRSLINKAQDQAYKTIDNLRVQTYWQIGERIVRGELEHGGRADYGKHLIENLAVDIGLSRRLLYDIVKFYQSYQIVQTVSAQLSWSHFVGLIYIKKKEVRKFYEQMAIQNRWSVRELRKQIHSKLFERMKKEGQLAISSPLPIESVEPERVFKNIYNFEFLELKEGYDESMLKKALLEKLEEFLRELGPDFFIGRREVPILIGGNYDRVDLELFHAGLLCYILVEVKTEKFRHSHVSQIYSYLNWYKENKWRKGQRQPIGLIVCKTKDEETVHYALGDLKNDIFVAEYQLKLPSEKLIETKLRELN